MSSQIEFKQLLSQTDFSNRQSIERYAAQLRGMSFQDILDLGITPPEYNPKNYSESGYKGGMGNLIEERFFGYKTNSDERPDFPEAGVEVKATCFDIRKKDKVPTAGERLVLTMIPHDKPINVEFESSHLWQKCSTMLLIFYHRDKTVGKYDQTIEYVGLFTPPVDDLKIIQEDYETIVSYIQSGRADELSEGLTKYLGAATKGATAASSVVTQYYPYIEKDGTATRRQAKKRAFSFKRQYMDYVLHHYLMGERDDSEAVIDRNNLDNASFEEHITGLISKHVGKTDREIAGEYGLPYTGGKAQWTTLVYRMLGIRNNRAKEFIKAGISVRAVRIEEGGKINESLSFAPFEFIELLNESWSDSAFRSYLDETKFFFVVFCKRGGEYRLQGSLFWNMPTSDIEGEAKRCWTETRETIIKGVKLVVERRANGRIIVSNNLPGMSDNRIVHVRPHAQRSAYKLDGFCRGDIHKDGSKLPDGRWMTKQSFWFNNGYVLSILNKAH